MVIGVNAMDIKWVMHDGEKSGRENTISERVFMRGVKGLPD